MKIILFTILLFITSPFVLIHSDTSKVMFCPQFTHYSTFALKDFGFPIQQDPNALWISDQQWNSKGCKTSLSISQKFVTTCNGSIIMHIVSTQKFKVFLNGINPIFTGQANILYHIPINDTILRNCKNYNLLTINLLGEGCSNLYQQGAIKYSLVQDDSHCYYCQKDQFYDLTTCSCKSHKQSNCPLDLIKFASCGDSKFFDTSSCGCICKVNQLCSSGFNFNAGSCQCLPDAYRYKLQVINGALIKN